MLAATVIVAIMVNKWRRIGYNVQGTTYNTKKGLIFKYSVYDNMNSLI